MISPILLKNSDLAQTRNFACPLNRIARLRHQVIEAYAENLVQEPRSAFAPASSEIAPLQIHFDEIEHKAISEFFNSIRRKRSLA